MGELRQKTVKGLAWNTANRLTMQIIHFVIGIVLARLLCPADFGLLAMVSVFTSVLTIFTDGGLSTALVRKENRTEIDKSTVFWYNLIACWLLYCLLFVAAPWISDFYNMPCLKRIIRVVTLTLLISPLGNIQGLHFLFNLDFKTPTIISVTTMILSGSIALALAYNGYGVWALVGQSLTGAVFTVLFSTLTVRWHPAFVFSNSSFKDLFGFSSKLLASQCLNRIYENITPLIVGKFYTPAQLGYYEKARGWATLPSKTVNDVIQNVTFPVMSKMQGNVEQLANNYRRMIRTSAFVVFPMMIGLAAIARPLTLYVVTEKWENSIILLQLLCFSMMWYPVHSMNLNLLTVLGRSDLF